MRRKIEEERVVIVKAIRNKSCSSDFGSSEIKGRPIADVTEITNVKKTGFRDSRDVGETLKELSQK